MWVDEAVIFVKGGSGGDGCISFHHEKFKPLGGPDGGDGGRGGDVVIQATKTLKTLFNVKKKQRFEGGRGEHGKGNNRHGRSGREVVIKVPIGTQIFDKDRGELIADLCEDGEKVIVAQGGVGGRGNARFKSSVRQAPRISERGAKGEERFLKLELKLIADVCIVGYPNVGKSTFLSRVSHARPKIADYPFTTIVPRLGVVDVDGIHTFVLAEIPGLVKDAHKGVGLGTEFLRHIERTRLILHLLDITRSNPLADLVELNQELRLFNPKLCEKPQVVAINKIDLDPLKEVFDRLKGDFSQIGIDPYPVSGATGEGVKALISEVFSRLSRIPAEPKKADTHRDYIYVPPFEVSKVGDVFFVKGRAVERAVFMTDFDNPESVSLLQKKLRKLGVEDALVAQGVKDGDIIKIGEVEFEYWKEIVSGA